MAIIGILAAIAIPNFLQAQVRAKAARAVGELHTLATALETYHVDHGQYPFDGGNCSNSLARPYWYIPWDLTTPIDYISTNLLIDPFREHFYTTTNPLYERYRYQNVDSTWGGLGAQPVSWVPAGYCDPTRNGSSYYSNVMCIVGHWCLHSLGPDRVYTDVAWAWANSACGYPAWPVPYDPTNGTVSFGNIMKSQKTQEVK